MNEMLNRFVGNISPAALLVSSFFWSWFDVVPFSPALFLAKGSSIDPKLFIISFVVGTICMALCASSAGLRTSMLKPKVFAACSLVCGSLGTLAVYLGINGSSELFVAGCVLVGMYQGVGIILVGSVATCEGTTNALIHLAAALPLNIVSILLVVFLRPLASVAFIAILPLLATLFFAAYIARDRNRSTLGTVAAVSRPPAGGFEAKGRILGCDRTFLAIVLAATFVFGFANYHATVLEPAGGPLISYAPIVWRAITSFAVLVGYLFFSWRPYSILRIGLLLMSMGLVVCGAACAFDLARLPLATSPIFIGFACFDLLIWAIMIMSRYSSGTSLLKIICVVEALDEFGMLAGTIAGMAVGSDGMLVAFSFVACGGILLLATQSFFNSTSSMRKVLKKQEVALVDSETQPEEPEGSLPLHSHRESASKLAARYFLTARETEVLALLLAGRSVPYIAERLHLSDNTVKTHVRHLYTKLDVHNRQELLNLVFPPQD